MTLKLVPSATKILVVDDDPASVRLVRAALEFDGYQVMVAESGQQGIERIASWKPHLVLLDVSMPGLDGIETLKNLRTREEYVSALFVSGKSDINDVVKGLDAGADDYISKPFNAKELLARVRTQLRIKFLNDQLSNANARLKELVDKDDLTGLFNMRSLYDRLDNELDRARRFDRGVSVIMMDMDHFKSVNDNHDHLFGSFVLAEVGRIIRSNIRSVDYGARYGGDEFLVVLTEIGLNGAKSFADRLRRIIGDHEFKMDGHTARQTVSIGLACAEKEATHIDARVLVRFADHALYQAKEQGRNCVVVINLSEHQDFSNMPINGALMRKVR